MNLFIDKKKLLSLQHKYYYLRMNRYKQIKEIVEKLEEDFGKFYEKNNKAAGTRIRKAMQDLKNLAMEIRKEVQEIKNASEKKD